MHPPIKRRATAAAANELGMQTPRETPVADDDSVSAPLLALIRDDADLCIWLQHTGYFNLARRERVLEGIRKLQAVDEERHKLVLELHTETAGLFQPSSSLPVPSSSSPSLSCASVLSVAAGAGAYPDVPGAARVASSSPASTATSSVAESVPDASAARHERRGADPEEEPSPLASARLRSASGRPGGAAPGRADTRFFLVKCFDSVNVYMSQRDGLWATQAKNGPIFTEAFEECQSVILFFSINKSRAFQGFARMTSAPDPALVKPDWVRNINLAARTEPFRIEWISTAETEFDGVGDLKNPLNEFRSIVVGRDGQEYPPECGRKMMALLNRHPGARPEDPSPALARRARPRSPHNGARGPFQWRRRQRDTSARRTRPVPNAPAEPPPRENSLNLIDC